MEAAEQLDHYRLRCHQNELNHAARAGTQYIFHPDPVLQAAAEASLAKYEVGKGCRVVTLHPSADEGFPHTRPPNLICLPTSYHQDLDETMLHEALHIHQRNYPDLWMSYSIRQGWWPCSAWDIPDRWRLRVRINPDTMVRPFWSWETRWIPLPLFVSEARPVLSQCDIRWFDLKTGVFDSVPPASFIKRYGMISQPEHPYETGAVELSKRKISTYKELERVLTTE
jgi:hypothetical protein